MKYLVANNSTTEMCFFFFYPRTFCFSNNVLISEKQLLSLYIYQHTHTSSYSSVSLSPPPLFSLSICICLLFQILQQLLKLVFVVKTFLFFIFFFPFFSLLFSMKFSSLFESTNNEQLDQTSLQVSPSPPHSQFNLIVLSLNKKIIKRMVRYVFYN